MMRVVVFAEPGPVEADIVLTLLEEAWDEGTIQLHGCVSVRRIEGGGWRVRSIRDERPLHPSLLRFVAEQTAAWSRSPVGTEARWTADLAAGESVVFALISAEGIQTLLELVGRRSHDVMCSEVGDAEDGVPVGPRHHREGGR